jgi:large subunit ribosomal protein L10
MTKTNYPTRKVSALANLKDLFSQSKSVAVIDYSGLKVSQATQLRRDVKAAGGQVVVAKNTLFKIASGIDSPLSGLSAYIFALTDEISPLKAVADFAKKNGLLTFKSGFLGTKPLSASETESLANTPSKETSVSKLLYLLNYQTSRLAATLDAIAKR